MQQYWVKERGPYRFMPAAEMARSFRESSMGRAAAEELAQPPQRTKQGALQSSSETHGTQHLLACLGGKLLLGVRLLTLSLKAVAIVLLSISLAELCKVLQSPAV